jgi:hypothetical protein
MAEGCDQAYRDRITSDVEDYRNCLRGRFGGKCRSGGIRYGDYGDPTPNQIGDHFRKPVIVPLYPTVFDRHVLALDEAGFGEASAEVGENFDRVPGRPRAQISDHRH